MNAEPNMWDLKYFQEQLAQCRDVMKEQRDQLAAAHALLDRVFGSGCVYTGSRIGPITDCACADANGATCGLSSEVIPLDGTRSKYCPYLALEKK